MSELEHRRQRAREAYHDATNLPEKFTQFGLADAIEIATRVQMRGDVYDAAYRAYDVCKLPHPRALEAAIKAAFEAAGFEVEE